MKLVSWEAERLGGSIAAIGLPAPQLSLSPASRSFDC
jgi:hypothetical protein